MPNPKLYVGKREREEGKLKDDDPLFVRRNGKRITTSNIQFAMRKINERVGGQIGAARKVKGSINPLSLKYLRRAFSIACRNARVDREVREYWLGHSDNYGGAYKGNQIPIPIQERELSKVEEFLSISTPREVRKRLTTKKESEQDRKIEDLREENVDLRERLKEQSEKLKEQGRRIEGLERLERYEKIKTTHEIRESIRELFKKKQLEKAEEGINPLENGAVKEINEGIKKDFEDVIPPGKWEKHQFDPLPLVPEKDWLMQLDLGTLFELSYAVSLTCHPELEEEMEKILEKQPEKE
ncbi:hypothetical protein AKJ45_03210 [candidate division MSBL1 archaeon SCGC-AAA261F19]|uniref:Tyr recombinase domain-containing protein n=1 Tax=candidate division MSBL1 archaeon SCGC-AAA261F19 TaxID=1698275 RepID=A0A133V8S1_9EURY|nr:hypothetical protein AKJ45_03210 [candidate division MSBL1 archaeon SCGC-AAA261F19]